MTTRSNIGLLAKVLAALLAFSLIAAACGDDSGGDDGATSTDGTSGDDGGDDGSDDGSDDGTTDGTDGTDTPECDENQVCEDGGDDGGDDGSADPDPVYGGTVTIALEAETNSGWLPATEQCAISCHWIQRAIMEPLFLEDADGNAAPFLASGFEFNDDFTEVDIFLREGISFTNGEAFDADAVVANFVRSKAGTILGQVLVDMISAEKVDEYTVKLTFQKPQSQIIEGLTGQLGYMGAPAMMAADADPTVMIGTGPFMQVEWNPDVEFVAERNPNYWRSDEAGNQLPFLDGIVFRPIPDKDARLNAVQSGDVDINMSSFSEDQEFWLANYRTVPETKFRETTYLLINNAQAPMDDERVRRALALCMDRSVYQQLRAPASEIANGPFAPGVAGYLADTGFPEFDPEAGRALLAEIGDIPTIEYGTTPVPANVITADLITGMWSDNCGIDTEVVTIEQGNFITQALLGNFQVFLWRNHGAISPGSEDVWWHSDHGGPTGALAIANFGRIDNPDIDAALDATNATRDPAELTSIAEDINREFAENVHNIWLNWTEWTQIMNDNVYGLGSTTLPDGGRSMSVIAGRVSFDEVFIAQG
ncbi:MAG: ABC transporter substrate-binding protein [Acidimicrobiales bacterium]|nr:ABC transporter substrate-binding protein [Acidimicrobiales bacterium]